MKPFLEATQSSLTVAMYDFNAAYIAKTFIDTVRDGEVKAALTWDDSMTAPETEIRAQIRRRCRQQIELSGLVASKLSACCWSDCAWQAKARRA